VGGAEHKKIQPVLDHKGGTQAPWYSGWDLSDERRAYFRERSRKSRAAKLRALSDERIEPAHPINAPTLDPAVLMPQMDANGIASLSLFSGGGGLDLGFDRAGYAHVASFDTLEAAGRTLLANRPHWDVHCGVEGDVRGVDWRDWRGAVDVVHGGPPCQPFSVAGRQKGQADARNMLPEFVRTVLAIKPSAFVAENVPALAGPKFADYLRKEFHGKLARTYRISLFKLAAHEFGIPQVRRRVFMVGFRSARASSRFVAPVPSHSADHLSDGSTSPAAASVAHTPGARLALGLADIGFDALAPTLRSTLTGPRHTTSVLSSASAQRTWSRLRIWPSGVAPTREAAQSFVAENGHFRLSVADCAVLQGFPADWQFDGPVYLALGQLGNSVAPPVAYQVGMAVARALAG
jgi:DNA (cytosine-5)-methyltransferase 1